MAKRFYKKYYKRKYQAKKKTLSKRNIFSKKGAKSQAYQINALNKKIDRVYRMTAPKIQTWETNQLYGMNYVFGGNNLDNFNGLTLQGGVLSNAMRSGTPLNWNDSLLRIRNMSLNIMVKFNSVNSLINSDDAQAAAAPYYNQTVQSTFKSIVGRITILRLKNSTNTSTGLGYIHNVYQTEGTNYKIRNAHDTVFGALNKDITTYGKIVYDKRIVMGSFNTNSRSRNIKIRLPGGTYRRPESFQPYNIMGKDYILCMSFGIEGMGSEYNAFCRQGDAIDVSTYCKIAYVNDNVEDDGNRKELKKGLDFLGKEGGLNTDEEE